jgi:hypothetical protein
MLQVSSCPNTYFIGLPGNDCVKFNTSTWLMNDLNWPAESYDD